MNLELIETKDVFKKASYRSCNFSYTTVTFYDNHKEENYNILVMKDLFTGTELSLTNCIEEAAKIAMVNISKETTFSQKMFFILYSDTENQWDIFNLATGKFHYLGIKSNVPREEIYRRAEKYINGIRK